MRTVLAAVLILIGFGLLCITYAVKEAAQFPGALPETLRNWDQSRKFNAVRHP